MFLKKLESIYGRVNLMESIVQNKRNTNQRSLHRWWALIILALAQFLVFLDSSIVNIALPSLGKDLHLDTTTLSWVITANVVPFGGLLLLGGRLADRFGHRRIFMVGVIGFIIASASAGLAASTGWLLVSRAIQGTSAAFLAPAALALLTLLFTQPKERAKALGIWGTVAGLGSVAGVLLGGILTSLFGWSAVFFINVPVGVLVAVVIPILVTKDPETKNMKTDWAGAVTVTTGLMAIVSALSVAKQAGFPITLALAAIGIALLVSFVLIEKRSTDPLVPLSIFRKASVTSGNLAMLLIGGATVGLFFALSVYMQKVLQYDALTTGLAQLPLAGSLVIVAGIVPVAIHRLGTKWTLVLSLVVLAIGLIWLSLAPSNASFITDLLGSTILVGGGLGGAFVSSTELAVSGVTKSDEGLASGLVNTSQQIGGAVGIAILASIAAIRTDFLASAGGSPSQALTGGFSWVFIGAALFAIVGALLVIVIQRKDHQSPVKSNRYGA